jgi:hypothetical protein
MAVAASPKAENGALTIAALSAPGLASPVAVDVTTY